MRTTSKYLLLLLVSTLLVSIGRSQQPAWQQSRQWTLYNVRGSKFYKIAADSLNKYSSRQLNDDSMHMFLSRVSPMSSDKAPVWMGAHVTSCIVDHKIRKIDISFYGGYFYDETEKKYYSVSQEVQKDWLNYLSASAGALSSQK